ncbi:MAG: ribonuclease H-like domain-containing protein, partial [Candidatus Acidiferrales bacterium]
MLSLRQRLAGLAAARAPLSVTPRTRPVFLAGEGYSVREEVVPLTARPGLPHLPALDPQIASLLLAEPEGSLPSLTDWLFLDLETTGLAGGTGTYAFLVGLAQLVPGGLRLRQFFLRDLAAESALLAALEPFLRGAKVLVTYNGKQFDAPLLETRFRLARRSVVLEPAFHLDLLYPARRLWKGRFSSLRLLNLEQELFGYRRPDDVPGENIPGLYFDFLRHGREQPLEAVFRHNAHDIVTLAAVAARILSLLAAPETT